MKRILLLDDGATGHLRQSQAVCRAIQRIYGRQGVPEESIVTDCIVVDCSPSPKPTSLQRIWRRIKRALRLNCRVCTPLCDRCVKPRLRSSDFRHLVQGYGDVVVSTNSTGRINLWVASRWKARSIVVMPTPSEELLRKVDLAIIPRYHNTSPNLKNVVLPELNNVLITEGAPNVIEPHMLDRYAAELSAELGPTKAFKVGLLLGGDHDCYPMPDETISSLLDQLDDVLSHRDGELFVTTSPRTNKSAEQLLKRRLSNNSRCRLLVIANSQNRAGVVEAILGLCDVVLVSPESISMISEAASSNVQVLVYNSESLRSKKLSRFVESFVAKGFIDNVPLNGVSAYLNQCQSSPRESAILNDRVVIEKRLESIL